MKRIFLSILATAQLYGAASSIQQTPLPIVHQAVLKANRWKDYAELKGEISHPESLFIRDHFGRTPSHLAASKIGVLGGKEQKEYFNDLNKTEYSESRYNAEKMHHSYLDKQGQRYLPVLFILLEAPGADIAVNIQDNQKATPLHKIFGQFHSDKEESLGEALTEPVKGEDPYEGDVPAVKAAVKALINAGASVDVPDIEGKTPLLWAAIRGYPQVVRMLLAAGANPLHADNDGKTILHIAAQHGFIQIMEEVLRRLSADEEALKNFVNRQDVSKGRTPLHWVNRMREGAVAYKKQSGKVSQHMTKERAYEMMQMLVQAGANPTIKDNTGKSVLDWVKEKPALGDTQESELKLIQCAAEMFVHEEPQHVETIQVHAPAQQTRQAQPYSQAELKFRLDRFTSPTYRTAFMKDINAMARLHASSDITYYDDIMARYPEMRPAAPPFTEAELKWRLDKFVSPTYVRAFINDGNAMARLHASSKIRYYDEIMEIIHKYK